MPSHRKIFKQGHSRAITLPRHQLRDIGYLAGSLAILACIDDRSLILELHPPGTDLAILTQRATTFRAGFHRKLYPSGKSVVLSLPPYLLEKIGVTTGDYMVAAPLGINSLVLTAKSSAQARYEMHVLQKGTSTSSP